MQSSIIVPRNRSIEEREKDGEERDMIDDSGGASFSYASAPFSVREQKEERRKNYSNYVVDVDDDHHNKIINKKHQENIHQINDRNKNTDNNFSNEISLTMTDEEKQLMKEILSPPSILQYNQSATSDSIVNQPNDGDADDSPALHDILSFAAFGELESFRFHLFRITRQTIINKLKNTNSNNHTNNNNCINSARLIWCGCLFDTLMSSDGGGLSAFHEAARHNHLKVCRFIIHLFIALSKEIGMSSSDILSTSIDKADAFGKTPLHYSVGEGHTVIVEFFLNCIKELLNVSNDEITLSSPALLSDSLSSPPSSSYISHNPRVLYYRSIINHRDSSSRTPLHYTTMPSGDHQLTVAELLMKAGADPFIRDIHGKPALDWTSTYKKRSTPSSITTPSTSISLLNQGDPISYHRINATERAEQKANERTQWLRRLMESGDVGGRGDGEERGGLYEGEEDDEDIDGESDEEWLKDYDKNHPNDNDTQTMEEDDEEKKELQRARNAITRPLTRCNNE